MEPESDAGHRAREVMQIAPDLPIQTRGEDRLNRASFSRAVAKVISGWRGRPSLVIGLFGEWGSGKSSIKNMVVESLADDPRKPVSVLEFSPWQISGQEILAQTFFSEVGRAIGRIPGADVPDAKRRAARWKAYSTAICFGATAADELQVAAGPTSHLNLIASAMKPLLRCASEVLNYRAKRAEAEASFGELSLEEIKQLVAADLESLPQPLLVVLDDIDRLTKVEICLMLQLIRANADFPNIIYLMVAHREALRCALQEIAPGRADHFIEKIVQISFDVPAMNRRQYDKLLFEGLDTLLGEPQINSRFSREYWLSLSRYLIPLFTTVRDTNRFLAGLAFHVELFRSRDTFEVNPVDLIALEALRFFEPALYKRIAGEKQVLTLEPSLFREAQRDSYKERAEALVSLASNQRQEAVRQLLGKMFPPSGLASGSNYGDGFENRWFQELRVCSYQAFDRYFQLATPEGDVSQAEIDELIRSTPSKRELDVLFASLAKRNLIDVMLARLSSLAEKIPAENTVNLLAALFDIVAPHREYGLLDASPSEQILRISYWLLRPLEESQRIDLLLNSLESAVHLGLSIKTLAFIAHEPSQGDDVAALLAAPESREKVKQACIRRIQETADRNGEDDIDELFEISGYWVGWDEAGARRWVAEHLNSRASVSDFLKHIQLFSDGTGGPKKFINVASFERIVPPEVLMKAVESYLVGDLSADEEASIKLLRAAMKRHEIGPDNNPFAIFQE